MMTETTQAEIDARLDSATAHLAAADLLAGNAATRGGAEQVARLLAAAAEASLAGALMVRRAHETVDELADLVADMGGMRRADREPPLADSFAPGAIDRAWDDRKDQHLEDE